MGLNRKKKVTQADIARACKLDQGSVSRILNKDTRDSFSPETVQTVFRAARELGYVHPALVNTNRRHSPRKKATIRANVTVVIGTSTSWDRGSCEIQEISGSGMLLKNFQTKKKALPMDRFRLDLNVTSGPLRGIAAKTTVVRFSNNEEEYGLAVQFTDISEDARKKILRFLKRGGKTS